VNFLKQPKSAAKLLNQEESFLDENYSNLCDKILFAWGSVECLNILVDCVSYDFTARGTRQGFEFAAISEIQSLLLLHLETYPLIQNEWTKVKRDLWRSL
jgi:hypothetical protein